MSVPFLIGDACVDFQDVSRALVWLSACVRLANLINRPNFICDVGDAGPSCIIFDYNIDSSKGCTTLIFAVREYVI